MSNNFTYQIVQGLNETIMILSSSGAWIPNDENNRHYQEYLAWVAEGNTAEEWTGE
jgi:hypothetical protein